MERRSAAHSGFLCTLFCISLATGVALGQQATQPHSSGAADQQMGPMQHEHGTHEAQGEQHVHKRMAGMHHHEMGMPPKSFVENILHHSTSGTSAEPNSASTPMLMVMKKNWTFMFHAVGWVNELQQSGPRGFDKLFSTNWFMPMAQRDLGPGQLTLRTMLSLEPATISERRYPELFQLGETAFARPIVDGQHPHDFVMELAALYDLKFRDNTLISFYAAPVGDPAMGPTAYPHRISASENPMATLGHHLEDSTHIANDVITAGVTYKKARLEASGFHGREPDEYRWNINSGKIDSWSVRFTVNPSQNWSTQYSIGHLVSPEALHPEQDVRRMTASIMYNRPLAKGNWATTLLWGRNQDLGHHQVFNVFNGYLAESTLRLGRQNLWGRLENVDRTNELVLGENPEPAGFDEHFAARIQAYTFGYDHEIGDIPHLSVAVGGQLTLYGKPHFLDSIYGDYPIGGVVLIRLRPVSAQH